MNLNIKERLLLLGCLPKEGNFITLKIINQVQVSLSFDEKEVIEFELKLVDGNYAWNQ